MVIPDTSCSDSCYNLIFVSYMTDSGQSLVGRVFDFGFVKSSLTMILKAWSKNTLSCIRYMKRRGTEELNTIIDALLAFHEHTCIRFVRRKRRHRQFIHFFSGTGCWSYIGRLRGGQMISIMRNGCVFKSTVQHEVLHALAFHHEHARSDRDEHVEILWENIIPGRESNFDKEDTNNLETSYDFGSVMHYTKTAFSRNNEPTIQAKDATIDSFGEATEMSSNDIARVNRLYNCN
ncbi:uncharacterized protein V6R79_005790 [Siganus canaliculatus]